MADANIFQQYLQPVKSVQDYSNDMDRQEQNALTLAASRQSAADDTAVRTAYQQGGGDTNKIRQLLGSSGQYKALQAFDKNQIEVDDKKSSIRKNTTAADASAYDLEQKKRVTAASRIASFQTPQDAISDIQARVQSGEMSQEQAATVLQSIPKDLSAFSQWQLSHMRQFLTPQQQIELNTPKYVYEGDGQTKVPVQTNANAPGFVAPTPIKMQSTPGEVLTDVRTRNEGEKNRKNALTIASMTDARSREVTAATVSKPFEVTGPDGAPILVQQDKQGNILPVNGYSPKVGAGGSLTESQGNATNFAGRMKSASEILIPLEDKGITAGSMGTMAAGSAWTNFMATPEGRQYNQAAKNWVSANLRKESGAAIPESEMAQEIKKYFGIPGDDKGTLDQKRQARTVAEEGMMVQAGPGSKTVPATLNKTRPGATSNSARTPDGQTHTFPNAAAAAAFRKAAGL